MFVNYLLARGIQVTQGRWYDENFKAKYGHNAKYQSSFHCNSRENAREGDIRGNLWWSQVCFSREIQGRAGSEGGVSLWCRHFLESSLRKVLQ